MNQIPNLTELRAELATVNSRINKLSPQDAHLDGVAKAFHLGMVGGSGRNVRSLNKRREAYLDKSIKNSKELVTLYSRQRTLETLISEIESGEYQKKLERSQNKKLSRIEGLVQWWNQIEVGKTTFTPGNNELLIVKKNKKSLVTQGGTKWTAAEVIGAEAAKLL